MHERPKWVRARGNTIVRPFFHPPPIQPQTHTCTLCPRVTDGWMLANANSKLPPPLPSITLTAEDSWEAGIPSSQLSEENKRVCGTPPTHTCMCSDVHSQPPHPYPYKLKKLSLWATGDHISAAWACQPAEVWVLSLGHLLKVKVREIIPTLLTRAGRLIRC